MPPIASTTLSLDATFVLSARAATEFSAEYVATGYKCSAMARSRQKPLPLRSRPPSTVPRLWLIMVVRSEQSHPKIVTPGRGRTLHLSGLGVRVHWHHSLDPR
jgi:hypothetical protein